MSLRYQHKLKFITASSVKSTNGKLLRNEKGNLNLHSYCQKVSKVKRHRRSCLFLVLSLPSSLTHEQRNTLKSTPGIIPPDHRPLEVDVWACPHPPGLMEGTGPPGDTSPRPPTIPAADGARDGLCGGPSAAPRALLASFLAPKLGQMTHTRLLSKRGKLVAFYQFTGSESWSRICFVCPVAAHKSLSCNNWIIGRLKMRAWRQGWAAPCFGGFNLTCQVKPDISCASKLSHIFWDTHGSRQTKTLS